MTQTYTAFLGQQFSLWEGDLDQGEWSEFAPRILGGYDRHDVLSYATENIALNNSETWTINLAGLLVTDQVLVEMRVVGSARLTVVGLDYIGGALTNYTDAFGSTLWPGNAIVHTSKVTSMTVTGLADGTTIQLFSAIVAAPGDPRLL